MSSTKAKGALPEPVSEAARVVMTHQHQHDDVMRRRCQSSGARDPGLAMKPSPISPWAKTPAPPAGDQLLPAKAWPCCANTPAARPATRGRCACAPKLQQGGQHQADDDDGDDPESLGPSLPSNSSTPMMG